MKVVIFGATGMVGKGVLLECLDDARVEHVLLVSRHATDVSHPKIREIVHADFAEFGSIQTMFTDLDACFYCLGVTVVGLNESQYYHLTYDLALAAATALAAVTAGRLTFCYVSGEGTDSTERGRIMWARVKGKTENALLRLPFKAAFMFRPGYIQPLRGIRSKTRWYQALYDVMGPFYPIVRRAFPGFVTTTINIGRAMIHVAATGSSKQILSATDINELSA
ncbi:MAG TPA: NAD-dependent epimerase/dehydratase family protein [Vicinamibacterales bacterium]|nr:NAD-dependent epimerase/dehydratase family protein [Vicinamibacterales bacterium]